MLKTFRPALAAVALLLLPAAAMAQTATPASPPASAEQKTDAAVAPAKGSGGGQLAVCRADLAKLCPDAKGPDRRKCLTDNTAKLSPECASAFGDVEAKAKAVREACATDAKSYCADAAKKKGGPGIAECLKANEAKLTPACSTAVKARYPKG
ncbi:MAG: hypothetical protein AB7O57_06755 [Hyphomicrobiaceae bacterium]